MHTHDNNRIFYTKHKTNRVFQGNIPRAVREHARHLDRAAGGGGGGGGGGGARGRRGRQTSACGSTTEAATEATAPQTRGDRTTWVCCKRGEQRGKSGRSYAVAGKPLAVAATHTRVGAGAAAGAEGVLSWQGGEQRRILLRRRPSILKGF